MARWKLLTCMYLNTADGTEWEYREIDGATGREVRKRRRVPRYLDINDPGDWTNRFGDVGISRGGSSPDGQGEIIVCWEGRGKPSDVVFLGDPTPDMSPVDDEAKEISASFADRWRYKPDTDDGSYTQSQISRIAAQAQDRIEKVEVEGLAELIAAIGTLVERTAPGYRLKA